MKSTAAGKNLGALFSLMTLVTSGCEGSDPGDSAGQPSGFLHLLLTDAPIAGNVQAITLTISGVEVSFANEAERPQLIIPPVKTFNLLDLRNGVTASLGIVELPAGAISQLRLIIESAGITVDGETSSLFVPSGEESGVKLNGEFEISPCFVTKVTIDFDAEKSVIQAPGRERLHGQKYLLKPVVQVLSVESELDRTAPALAIAQDRLITAEGNLSFDVKIFDRSPIDAESFRATLNDTEAGSAFRVTQSAANSAPLVLGEIGGNVLKVSVADVCGNVGQATAWVYRAEPGTLPEIFTVVGPEGGELSVTEPSSSLYGVSVSVPAGALGSDQAIAIGLSTTMFDRPAGRIAVGPAVAIDADVTFLKSVTVTLPFSNGLAEFFRARSEQVEVWRHEPNGWNRVGGEVFLADRQVRVETDSFSPLQPWVQYPFTLRLDTIAGGGTALAGDKVIDADDRVMAEKAVLQSPTSVAVGANRVILFNETGGSNIDEVSGPVISNLVHSDFGDPFYGGDNYTALAVGGEADPWFYYAVGRLFQCNPELPSLELCMAGLIRRRALPVPSPVTGRDEPIAGRVDGDPSEGARATDALLGKILGLDVDEAGNIYFAEMEPPRNPQVGTGHRVRMVDASTNTVFTVAGTGEPGFNGDDGPAKTLKLHFPEDASIQTIRMDGALLFVADTENHKVRAINISTEPAYLGAADPRRTLTIPPGHMVTVINRVNWGGVPLPATCKVWDDGLPAPYAGLYRPSGVALADKYLFVSDECHRVLIVSLDDLSVTTVAGVQGAGDFNGDGTGINSKLFSPSGLFYDQASQALLIADFRNHRIRRLHYKWQIHMKPDGHGYSVGHPEYADGSPRRPLRNLWDVQQLILDVKQRLPNPPPDDDIEVLIAPGTYYGRLRDPVLCLSEPPYYRQENAAEITWTYTMPNHSIKFVGEDRGNPPVFDGCNPEEECCEDNPPCLDQFNEWRCHCKDGVRRRDTTWFVLNTKNICDEILDRPLGYRTNLFFGALHVRGYREGAIAFLGKPWDPANWNGDNIVVDCVFEEIGDGIIDDTADPGFGTIRVMNSRNNRIVHNLFEHNENLDRPILMHGIYLAWHAQRNVILSNVFRYISGAPVNVRDFSDGNWIEANVFTATSSRPYDNWFCNHEERQDCFFYAEDFKWHPECPSFENTFTHNILDGKWSRDCIGGCCNGNLDQPPGQEIPSYLDSLCCVQGFEPDGFQCGASIPGVAVYGNAETTAPCSCAGLTIERCMSDCFTHSEICP